MPRPTHSTPAAAMAAKGVVVRSCPAALSLRLVVEMQRRTSPSRDSSTRWLTTVTMWRKRGGASGACHPARQHLGLSGSERVRLDDLLQAKTAWALCTQYYSRSIKRRSTLDLKGVAY
jgi:hypothetical protein